MALHGNRVGIKRIVKRSVRLKPWTWRFPEEFSCGPCPSWGRVSQKFVHQLPLSSLTHFSRTFRHIFTPHKNSQTVFPSFARQHCWCSIPYIQPSNELHFVFSRVPKTQQNPKLTHCTSHECSLLCGVPVLFTQWPSRKWSHLRLSCSTHLSTSWLHTLNFNS